ncbi:putative esterase [Chitinophaga sp. W2I13]|uniref:hypothetical protein n=1 Tax=Chitinophaga sp. W2I13 TaxID=3373923 RepID=UPI003D1FA888
MRFRLLFFLLMYCAISQSQPTQPADYGLQAFTIHDNTLGTIRFYVSSKDIGKKKPVLLALDGSGQYPMALFVQLRKGSFVANSFDQGLLELADKFHVVMISKPGINFCDTINIDKDSASVADAVALLPPSTEYRQRAGLQWRIAAASRVLDYVYSHFPVNKSKVVAYGYSEGAQVVPGLSVANKKITHCACINGSGLNQFYDFITAVRMKAAQGAISPQEAQQQVDSLFVQFASIYATPHDTQREWEGHSYQRWASFCSDIPMDNLTKLNIPIFMTAGTNDASSPIYGLEYVKLEFLRLGKKNLTFRVYPTDHSFQEMKRVNGKDTVISHKQEMTADMMKWLKM